MTYQEVVGWGLLAFVFGCAIATGGFLTAITAMHLNHREEMRVIQSGTSKHDEWLKEHREDWAAEITPPTDGTIDVAATALVGNGKKANPWRDTAVVQMNKQYARYWFKPGYYGDHFHLSARGASVWAHDANVADLTITGDESMVFGGKFDLITDYGFRTIISGVKGP